MGIANDCRVGGARRRRALSMTEAHAWTQSPGVDLATGEQPAVAALAMTAVELSDMYCREFGYVWHTLRRLGIPQRELPDVTHDVFVTVCRCLDRYDPSRPIRPWLFGVAFRVASDHRHLSRNAREAAHETIEVPDERPLPDERISRSQTRELVREALAALDPDRRAVLILHDIDDASVPEIARTLAVPENTLYSRLRVAREQFVAAIRRIQLRRGEP